MYPTTSCPGFLLCQSGGWQNLHRLIHVQSRSARESLPGEPSLISGGQELMSNYFLLLFPGGFSEMHCIRPMRRSRWDLASITDSVGQFRAIFELALPLSLFHSPRLSFMLFWGSLPTIMQAYVLVLLLRQPVSDMRQGEINVIIRP